ncbi:MAG: hypothetical protein R3A47_03240 [Polyangiales bacterium]
MAANSSAQTDDFAQNTSPISRKSFFPERHGGYLQLDTELIASGSNFPVYESHPTIAFNFGVEMHFNKPAYAGIRIDPVVVATAGSMGDSTNSAIVAYAGFEHRYFRIAVGPSVVINRFDLNGVAKDSGTSVGFFAEAMLGHVDGAHGYVSITKTFDATNGSNAFADDRTANVIKIRFQYLALNVSGHKLLASIGARLYQWEYPFGTSVDDTVLDLLNFQYSIDDEDRYRIGGLLTYGLNLSGEDAHYFRSIGGGISLTARFGI